MTVHQPHLVQHRFPWGLELLGAAILGAAVLFGVLLLAGHPDLLPSLTGTREITPAGMEAHPGKLADDRVVVSHDLYTYPGKAADDLVVPGL